MLDSIFFSALVVYVCCGAHVLATYICIYIYICLVHKTNNIELVGHVCKYNIYRLRYRYCTGISQLRVNSAFIKAHSRLYCRDDVTTAEGDNIYSIISSGQGGKSYNNNTLNLSENVHENRVSSFEHVHVCSVVICSVRIHPYCGIWK